MPNLRFPSAKRDVPSKDGLRSYARSVSTPDAIRLSVLLYGTLGAWIAITHFTPQGQAVYSALREYPPDCSYGSCYNLFFSLTGAIAAALWVAIFAVFALSKHTSVSHPKRFMARIMATKDILFNLWLADRLSLVHVTFSTVMIICGAMLIPISTPAVPILAGIAIVVVRLLGSATLARYIVTARDHDQWIRTKAQRRFERLMAKLGPIPAGTSENRTHRTARIERARGMRQELLDLLRPAMRQMAALQDALYINPFVSFLADITVIMAAITLAYDQSARIAIGIVSLLTVLGLGFVYGVALRLIIDIPEAEQGRSIRNLRLG